MREIIVFENVTLDGFMARSNGELDWAIQDDEITQYVKEGRDPVDTFLFGRVTFEMMARFWQSPLGESSNPFFAKALSNAPKIVFSRTLEKPDWKNTKVVNELNRNSVTKLKQEPGRNMMIFGSGTIVQQLTDLGLIDEVQLIVNPIVLGKGKPLFKDIKRDMNLKLLGAKTFSNGAVLLRYRPHNG